MTPSAAVPPPPAASNARDAVALPSVLVLLSGALGTLYGLSTLLFQGPINAWLMHRLAQDPRFADALKTVPADGGRSYFWPVFTLALSGLAIAGALKMRNLQSFGLAVAGTIASMILFPGCCCFGIPVGIWAIVVVMRPEVKSQFQ